MISTWPLAKTEVSVCAALWVFEGRACSWLLKKSRRLRAWLSVYSSFCRLRRLSSWLPLHYPPEYWQYGETAISRVIFIALTRSRRKDFPTPSSVILSAKLALRKAPMNFMRQQLTSASSSPITIIRSAPCQEATDSSSFRSRNGSIRRQRSLREHTSLAGW